MEIMKGWEPYSHESPSDTGVLLSQGFTGSTYSLLYLARKLAGAGLNVELVRLAGHGTAWQDLNRVGYRQWIQDAED